MPNYTHSVNVYSLYILKAENKLRPYSLPIPAYQKWYNENLIEKSEPTPRPINNIFDYLHQEPPEDSAEIALADVSTKDSVWDDHRYDTEQVGDIYGYNAEFERYHERMSDCSTFLAYGSADNDELKLKNANFCRVRHCPVCQWRRSLFWKSNMYSVYDDLQEKYPTHRWLFLTLTVKNCDITDLRETLKHMNKSWHRLVKRAPFERAVVGWIKTTEITKGKDGPTMAHPHFHVMLLVKPSYFSHNYIKHDEWSEMWQSVLRVDYMPVVNIKAVKANKKIGQSKEDAIKGAIMETLKYSVKPSDMIGNRTAQDNAWFYELTRQVFKLRFIASGGVLKDAFKPAEDITNDDLIVADESDDEREKDDRRLVFTYKKSKHKYFYSPEFNI